MTAPIYVCPSATALLMNLAEILGMHAAEEVLHEATLLAQMIGEFLVTVRHIRLARRVLNL